MKWLIMKRRTKTYKKNNITKQKMLKAIDGSGGIISLIANRLGCDWHTAKKYIELWEETKQAYSDELEKFKDICETTVLKSVQDGDVQTAKWVLSHKARDRGYGEKIEVDGQLTGEVKIIIQGEE
jgi:hypothetical protein